MSADPRRPERTFTIRQLCQEFKCTPRALRFYEDKGLLAPARQGLNRIYSYKDRARLQLILHGKRINLPLVEIRELLDLYDKGDGGAAQNAAALKRFRARLITLQQQRESLDQAIEGLKTACAFVEQKLAASRQKALAS